MAKVKSKKSVVYSVMEVAHLCSVVPQTVLGWIKDGVLNAHQLADGQYRVYPEDLVEFMEIRGIRVPAEVLDQCGTKVVVTPHPLLIVDDDRALNNVIARFLQKKYSDMQVFQAFTGFEAGSQMVVKQPRCILLDIDLPGVDGLKLCRHIKESDAFGKPAVVIVSALQDAELEARCRELGVSQFFHKPVNLPQLAEFLHSVF